MFFSLSRRNVEIRRSWKSAYRLYSGKWFCFAFMRGYLI
jgi:hypothetical protein